MKVIKWIVVTLLSLVLLIFVVAGVALYTFDPNQHKALIEEQVKAQTGRELKIAGDIGVSLFPWLGFELGEVSLSNAAGFRPDHFLHLQGAQVKVEILPLLQQQIRVDKVELIGFELELARNAKGVGNWEDLAGPPKAEEKPAGEPLSLEKLGIDIGGIVIQDAKFHWVDSTSGSDLRLNDLDLEIGRLRLGEDFPLQLAIRLALGEPKLALALNLSSQVNLDLVKQQYRLSQLKLDVSAEGETLPGKKMDLKMAAELLADLQAETLRLTVAQLATAGLEANASVAVDKLLQEPQISGRFNLPAANLRQTFGQLQIELPEMADPQTLTQVGSDIEFRFVGDKLNVSKLELQLDQSRLKGDAAVKLTSPLPAVKFQLQMSALDADRYLPSKKEEVAEAEKPQSDEDIPIELPMELLRQLDLDGRLQVEKLVIAGLKLEVIDLSLKAKQGVIDLKPLKLALYEGNLAASAGLDARKEQPQYGADLQLRGLSSGPLLLDLLGPEKDYLLGHGNVSVKADTQGASVNALKRALNGNLSLAFKDGAVKGFNLAQMLRKAEAKLTGKSFDEKAVPQTDFTALTVSGVIKNGVLNSNDLDLRSPLLRVSGAGMVDLPQSKLDYTTEVKLISETKGQGGKGSDQLAGLNIPVRASGPFDDIGIDLFLAKALGSKKLDEEKAKLQQQLDDKKAALEAEKKAQQARLQEQAKREEQKAREKAEREEQKAREKLQQEKQKLQDEAEQKLKNMLKF